MVKDVQEVRIPDTTGKLPPRLDDKKLTGEARQNITDFFSGNSIPVKTWNLDGAGERIPPGS